MKAHLAIAATLADRPLVLDEFLSCLGYLDAGEADVSYVLAYGGDDERCRSAIRNFAEASPGRTTLTGVPAGPLPGEQALDELVAAALALGATNVLLLSGDLLVPPPVPAHLLSLGVDIASEVFWTDWGNGSGPLPSAWQCDQYGLYSPEVAHAPLQDKVASEKAFLARLREPGTYPVGGVSSACTLLSRSAFEAGATFQPIPNLTLWGLDRHFCVRAGALGYTLWADTHYPPLHVRQEADLSMAEHFWSRWLPQEALL